MHELQAMLPFAVASWAAALLAGIATYVYDHVSNSARRDRELRELWGFYQILRERALDVVAGRQDRHDLEALVRTLDAFLAPYCRRYHRQ